MTLRRMVSLQVGLAACLLYGPQIWGQEGGQSRRQLQAECRITPLGPDAVRLDVDYELQTTPNRMMSLRARAMTDAGFDEQHFQSSISPAEAGRHTAQIILSFTGTDPVAVVDIWVELLAEGRERPRAARAFEFRRTFPLDAQASPAPSVPPPAPATPVETAADLQGALQLISDARAKEPPANGEHEAPRVLRGWSVRRTAADKVEVCAVCDTSHVSRGRVMIAAALLSRLPSTPTSAPTLMPDTQPAAVMIPPDIDGWSQTLVLDYPHKLQAHAAGVRVVIADSTSRELLDMQDIAHRMTLSPAPQAEDGGAGEQTSAPGGAAAPRAPEQDRPSIRPTAPEAGPGGAADLLKLPAADLGSRQSLAQPGDTRTGIIKLWAVRQLEHNLVEVQVVCKSPGAQIPTLTVTGALLRTMPADPLSLPGLFEGVAPVSATVEAQDGQAVAVLCFPYLGKEQVRVAGVRLVVTAPGYEGALDVLDTERAMTLSQPQTGGPQADPPAANP